MYLQMEEEIRIGLAAGANEKGSLPGGREGSL